MRRTPRRMLAAIAAMGMLAVGLTAPTAMAAEPVNGCKVYYPADTEITLATAAQDSDCWDAGMVSKDGRTFLGWSEERIPDITSGAEYTAAQSKIRTTIVMKAPGRTVYAVWTTMPTITYDANPPAGVENPPAAPVGITGEYNKPVSDSSGWKPGDTTLIPGYIFRGWTDTPNGNDTHDWSKPLTQQSTVVHAKWEAIGYKVRFDRNASDATGSMADQSFKYDQAQNLTANAFKRKGWTFTGWNTRKDGRGTAYTDRQSVTNLTTSNGGVVTLYAQWSHDPVRIHYDANGGQGSHADTNGNAYDTLTVPSNLNDSFNRPGFLLTGWNTQPDGKGTAYKPGDPMTMGTTDVTLYAQWSPLLDVMPVSGGEDGLHVNWASMLACAGAAGLLTMGAIISRRTRRKGSHRA